MIYLVALVILCIVLIPDLCRYYSEYYNNK